jgi:predicted AlkP superfamily pyrophosphatase or phosphodiesterase
MDAAASDANRREDAPGRDARLPVLPAYGGACIDGVVHGLLMGPTPSWVPEPARGARQIVLLVLDGLGWEQLTERAALAPALSGMTGGPITTVVPSTTATALTSLTTGLPPAKHGIVGYRLRVEGDQVLNVLRWRTSAGDARLSLPPEDFQLADPFGAVHPPVVTRAEFAETGFTGAHLSGVRFYGWRMPSTLVSTVGQLLDDGEPFVYAYYDGVDKVAHEFGLGRHYDAEVAAADRVAETIAAQLPPGAALVVTSDHGQVDVGDSVVSLAAEVLDRVTMLSGEGRFRWLHARPGQRDALAAAARRCHGDQAWVRTLDEATREGWFGGELTSDGISRLGDVVIAARDAVAFLDPGDTGEVHLRSRHGSLTSAEMLVPLLAVRA